METLKFEPSKLRIWLYRFDLILPVLVSLIPFWLVWIVRGFHSAFQEYIIDMPDHPGVFIIFMLFGFIFTLIRIYNYSLRYPVLINKSEIMQQPWLGKLRRISWQCVSRIQVFDGVNGYGRKFYRIRVFSNITVIMFSAEFKDIDILVDFIRQQALKYKIPIYKEEKINTGGLKFGSWDIDVYGKSNGILVTQISDIPMPKMN